MTARAKQIGEAGEHLRVHWDAADLSELERGFSAKLLRRKRTARLAKLSAFGIAAVIAMAALLFGFGAAPFGGSAAKLASNVSERSPRPVRLRDGSELTASPGTDWLERTADGDGVRNVELEVLRGRLRLSVVPHQPGEFRVRVADVLVEVIGTVFSVERQPDSVSVSVEHGRVRVTRGAEPATFLSTGERRTFTGEGASASSDPAGEATREQAPLPALSAHSPTRGPVEASWQALARDGDYAAAYGKLRLEAVKDVPGDLLLAADVARLSGHPAQAVEPLRRVTKQHAADPRAPLAAFTLGRVYLEDLGNPRDAALAFRLTRNLQPGGPMAESALAREVEALARAGETQKAKVLAQEYLSSYPAGSKRKLVQHYANEP